MRLLQTHEALPLVAGDGSGEPTKHVHAFGPQWAALYAPGYETTAFANPLLKCARRRDSGKHRWRSGTVHILGNAEQCDDSSCRGAAEAVKDAFSGVFGARR